MKKLLITTAFAVGLASPLLASEVYIDQAGGALVVDILQENGLNRVNTEANPANISGNDITVNVVQSGDNNEADLQIEQNANSTYFDYSAYGSFNTVELGIFGGASNTFSTSIVGDDNNITLCKVYMNSTCNGIIADNISNTIDVNGNNNDLALNLDSPDAINTFSLGNSTPSDFNIVNVEQSGVGQSMISMGINGSNNSVNVIQN